MCAEMLSLLRTPAEQLKWLSKREKSMVKAVRKRMRGECPVAGAGAPGSGAPRIPFSTAFTIDFLRFAGHFCCPMWVLRRDSFWGRVWYGLRTNLHHLHEGFDIPRRKWNSSQGLVLREDMYVSTEKSPACKRDVSTCIIYCPQNTVDSFVLPFNPGKDN